MRFRLGLLAGIAIGYVQGTKAGRERYEQLRQQWQKARRTEPAQRLSHELEHAAEKASETIGEAANKTVEKARSVVHRGDGSAGADSAATTSTDDWPVDSTVGSPVVGPEGNASSDDTLLGSQPSPLTEPSGEPAETPLTELTTDPALEEPLVIDREAAGGTTPSEDEVHDR